MTNILKLLFIICFIMLSHQNVFAQKSQRLRRAKTNDSILYHKIKRILKKYGKTDLNIGVYVQNLQDGSVKFLYHPKRLFKPASIAKIFTAYESLIYLGPNYQFATTIFAKKLSQKPVLKNAILEGDLYIKFSGDPSFTYNDLRSIFENLKIKTIKGNILLDNTMFDKQYAAPGGFTWDDRPFYYAAPSSPIIINKNISKAKMFPAITGQKANLSITNPTLLSIKNDVLTVRPKAQSCLFKSRYMGENKYRVYGCMFNNMKRGVKLNFALQDNNLMAHSYIQKLLTELKIQFKGKVKFGKASGNLKQLYIHRSAPLKELLKDVMQKSCNICASSLFKHIAAKYTNKQASDERAAKVMKSLLAKVGFHNFFIIKDGAGESRYNLVSPETVTNLLYKIYNNAKLREVFLNSLAQYGQEGTLKNRSLDKKFNSYIYGKTGSLKSISAFAGYYLPPQGSKYVFTIFINNHILPWETVKLLEDKILKIILENNKF